MDESDGKRADYGLDAPLVMRNLAIVGVVCLVAGLGAYYLLRSVQSLVASVLLIWGGLAGASMLVTSALMAWSSRVGKLRARDRIIAELALRGDETVLDVGCGRGLLLVAAARHLTTGRALGIDLWQAVDQSGNRSAVTLANARREGVLPRVAVITGDMRRLPLADGTVDVVVSSLAIHNIPDKEGRMQAIRAIARVLKPHGRLALLDFQQTDEYVQALHFLGWRNVQLSGPSFMMFPPVSLVKGRKPI